MNEIVYSSSPMKINFQITNKIITCLVTDSIHYNNDNQVKLIYVGTQDGQILKLVQKHEQEEFILLASWILDENLNEQSSVRNMVFAQVKKKEDF